MNGSDWISVDHSNARESDQPTTETVRGVKVSVQISPYDRPQAFRGRLASGNKVFRIEFKYSDEEPGELRKLDEIVSVELGKYSRKLLAIEVAVQVHNIGVIQLELVKGALDQADETVKRLGSSESRPNARLNYLAVDEVLQQGKQTPELLVPA